MSIRHLKRVKSKHTGPAVRNTVHVFTDYSYDTLLLNAISGIGANVATWWCWNRFKYPYLELDPMVP